MIQLYQYHPAFGLPNPSPFCMKVETYLRMAGLPYEVPAFDFRQMRQAPKGKLPFIVEGERTVADSSLIIQYLQATHNIGLDAWMSPEQAATALAWQRLLEEHHYWVAVYLRWIDPAGWAQIRPVFFKGLPAPLSWFVPALARRGIRQQLRGHGMGRHSRDEVIAMGCQNIDALAHFLGDKPFMMGDRVCSLDATAYAFLASLLWVPMSNPVKTHAAQHPQLERYCQRMKATYWA